LNDAISVVRRGSYALKDLIEREPVRQQRKQIQPPVPAPVPINRRHGFRPARAQRRHDFVIAQSRREPAPVAQTTSPNKRPGLTACRPPATNAMRFQMSACCAKALAPVRGEVSDAGHESWCVTSTWQAGETLRSDGPPVAALEIHRRSLTLERFVRRKTRKRLAKHAAYLLCLKNSTWRNLFLRCFQGFVRSAQILGPCSKTTL